MNISNDEFAKLLKESNSYANLARLLGYSVQSGSLRRIKQKIKDLQLDDSHIRFNTNKYISKGSFDYKNTKDVLVQHSNVNLNNHWKKRLIKEGILKNNCYLCGLEPIWNGKKLVLQLDHINGDNRDHRALNLRLLCPNCHSQTLTFSRIKNDPNKPLKKRYCIQCNTLLTKIYGLYCTDCFSLKRAESRKFNISKLQLEEMVKIMPITKIAEKLGVSDNSIRKRCKKLGIDYKNVSPYSM